MYKKGGNVKKGRLKKKKIIEKIKSQQKRILYLYIAFVSKIIEMIKSQQRKKGKNSCSNINVPLSTGSYLARDSLSVPS